ncbi:MAG: hypothetical protein ACYC6Y_15810, partial [Thermoguttaceae bacterium]
MRQLSCFLATCLLLGMAAPAVWAADEPAKEAAEKKAEPKGKVEGEKKAEAPKEEVKKEAEAAKPAETAPAAKTETKPAATQSEAKPEAPKPATYTVKADLFRIALELDGVFVAGTMTEVDLRPDSWQAFKVIKAVEHGEEVKKGDVLVEFETDKIDEAIADQEM